MTPPLTDWQGKMCGRAYPCAAARRVARRGGLASRPRARPRACLRPHPRPQIGTLKLGGGYPAARQSRGSPLIQCGGLCGGRSRREMWWQGWRPATTYCGYMPLFS